MASARKNVIARVQGTHARGHEVQRCLEKLTNATRDETGDMIAKAKQRCYQLRGRTIIIKTPEGSRRKKATRTDSALVQAGSTHPADEEEHQKDVDAVPLCQASARRFEQLQQAEDERAGEGNLPADAEPISAHAGQKRGRRPAASQAKPKRPKVQAVSSTPGKPLDTVVVSGRGTSPQAAVGRLTPANKPSGVGAGAAATPVQSQALVEAPVGQPHGNPVDKGARRARIRPKKQPGKDTRTEPAAEPSEDATTAAAPAAAGFSPRVTRFRGAKPTAANPLSSPSARAAKQARVKSTRTKRDMKEAQLGSPGMHPKAKTATEGGAIVPPVATRNVANPAAAATSVEKVDTAVATEQPSANSVAREGEVGPTQASMATEHADDISSAREADAGPLPAGASTNGPGAGLGGREADAIALTEAVRSAQVDAPQIEQRSGDVALQLSAVDQHDRGPRACKQDSLQQQLVSSEPKSHVPAQQPHLEKQPAATGNIRRMPAKIAAAVAMFGGIAAPAMAGSSCSVRAAVAAPLAMDAKAGAVPAPAPGAKAPRPTDELFSFGIKPKEQSSPTMPHFGSSAEQAAAACDAPKEMHITEPGLDEPAAAEQADAACEPVTEPNPNLEHGVMMESSPVGAVVPETSVEDMVAVASALGRELSDISEEVSEPKILDDDVQEADDSDDIDAYDAADEQAATDGEEGAGLSAEDSVRPDVRDRSLSLSLALQLPMVLAHGVNAVVGSDAEAGPEEGPEPSLGGGSVGREEVGPMGAAADGQVDTQAKSGTPADAGNSNSGDRVELNDCADSDEGARASAAPAPSALGAVQPVDAQAADAEGADVLAPVQLNKPKGGNLVAAVRSFLPQRNPSPPPAAGKKPVKVKALEAAQAAKQKEAARQAERALARAAERQRQGQGDAGPSNANARPGPQAPCSMRQTPTKSAAQQGVGTTTASTTTAGVILPAHAGTVTSTATTEDKRNDCAAGGAPASTLGSVRAKAAFFEQTKKATVEQGALRKGAGGPAAPSVAPLAMPSCKAGANARVALAAGDSEASLATSAPAAAQAVAPPSAVKPNGPPAGSRGANPALATAQVESVADKQKRVEAKRREEEERRRAELEARTKAKDDKLRNIEAAKQQRLGGGGGCAPRPPPPLIPNPLAVQPSGKRPPLNAAGAGAGQAASVQIKPEPENIKMGFAGPMAAKTPGPKLVTAKTPGAKAGPAAAYMVSPAVQMQVKLLPAVHAQPFVAGADGARAAGGAQGLPKTKAACAAQAKHAPVAVPAAVDAGPQAVKEERMTPGAVELTEEERRNVHAIQTSPYVMQVKPRTPGVLTSNKPIFNYEISPYRSDSDDDDEEIEDRRSKKPVPEWASHNKVLLAVRAQASIDPDTIFGTYPSTIDLVDVFSDMPPPSDKDYRGRPRRDILRRGSSGDWAADASYF